MKLPLNSAVLFLLTSAVLHGQDPDPLSKLDPPSRYAVQLLVDSASVLGLPTRPLLSNAYLGISRHADGRRIVVNVRRQLHAMLDARTALGPKANESEILSGAEVLQAGVPTDLLGRFRNAKSDRTPVYALTVLGDLITRGVPVDEASSTIVELWQRGAGDADFLGLWKGVEQDILEGQSPGAALQQRAREFPGRIPASKVPPPAGKPPDNPSSQ